MSKQQLKESIVKDIDEQVKLAAVTPSLRDNAILVLEQDLTADDWKDIDNMSTEEASDMVLSLARIKQGA